MLNHNNYIRITIIDDMVILDKSHLIIMLHFDPLWRTNMSSNVSRWQVTLVMWWGVTRHWTIWHPSQDVLLFCRCQRSKPCYLHWATLLCNSKQEAADPERQREGRLISPNALDPLIFLFLWSLWQTLYRLSQGSLNTRTTHVHT